MGMGIFFFSDVKLVRKEGHQRPVNDPSTFAPEVGANQKSRECANGGTTKMPPIIDAASRKEPDTQIEHAGLHDSVQHAVASLAV